LLAEQGPLLTSAVIAVVQALRVNPDKYAIIFGELIAQDVVKTGGE